MDYLCKFCADVFLEITSTARLSKFSFLKRNSAWLASSFSIEGVFHPAKIPKMPFKIRHGIFWLPFGYSFFLWKSEIFWEAKFKTSNRNWITKPLFIEHLRFGAFEFTSSCENKRQLNRDFNFYRSVQDDLQKRFDFIKIWGSNHNFLLGYFRRMFSKVFFSPEEIPLYSSHIDCLKTYLQAMN